MDALVVERSMSLFQWIDMASTLGVDGLELYAGFFENFEPFYLESVRATLSAKRLAMPMFCASPDFTVPDAAARRIEVEREKRMIRLVAFLGGQTCRVLSGQRYPDVSRAQGVDWVVECLNELLPYAEDYGITLVMENHYKDNYWKYPEFAQKLDVFLEILERVPSSSLGVNFDPSNAILAGDDPLTVLQSVKHRLVTMHASDRFLTSGTLDELRLHDGTIGYPQNLSHGVVGRGMIDYDGVFRILREVGFDGWISIEDGVNGLHEIKESADFLRRKIREHFGDAHPTAGGRNPRKNTGETP